MKTEDHNSDLGEEELLKKFDEAFGNLNFDVLNKEIDTRLLEDKKFLKDLISIMDSETSPLKPCDFMSHGCHYALK